MTFAEFSPKKLLYKMLFQLQPVSTADEINHIQWLQYIHQRRKGIATGVNPFPLTTCDFLNSKDYFQSLKHKSSSCSIYLTWFQSSGNKSLYPIE